MPPGLQLNTMDELIKFIATLGAELETLKACFTNNFY